MYAGDAASGAVANLLHSGPGDHPLVCVCVCVLLPPVSPIDQPQPVMVLGSAASAVTLLWFGLSGGFAGAAAARVVAGLLNGIIVSWKCSIGESCTPLEQGRVRRAQGAQRWGSSWLLQPDLGEERALSLLCSAALQAAPDTQACLPQLPPPAAAGVCAAGPVPDVSVVGHRLHLGAQHRRRRQLSL